MPRSFDGLRVVAFEARRSSEIGGLIERLGGRVTMAPALREVPLDCSPEADRLAEDLLAGRVDMLVLLTGVGTRQLLALMGRDHPREGLLAALQRIRIVARGPKPTAALREWHLAPTLTALEPNTSEEVLVAIDTAGSVRGKHIAIQEYGESNLELADALRQRGAEVSSVRVYSWALPEDLGPLQVAIREVASGEADVVAFTTGQQVRNVLEVARQIGAEAELRQALSRTLIGSIGPTCTAALRELGLGVDFEPDRGRMTDLVQGLARSAKPLLARKRASADVDIDTSTARRVDLIWPATSQPDPLQHSVFLRACRREPVDYTPIWIMRQAGRFLREYRELRAKRSFLELCKTPELAAEATLMAVDRLDVDAAIIFSDILLIAEPLGLGLSFDAGEGPRIHRPLRGRQDVDQLPEAAPAESLGFVCEAIRMTRRALRPDVPLIGFCGAPFTVASYLIEGKGSRNFVQTKSLMYRDPTAWHALMEKLSRSLASYLNEQIAAGASAVQLFDSWVGCLNVADYRTFSLPYTKALVAAIRPGVPVIYFAGETAVLLEAMRETGASVIGLDWRVDLAEAWARLGEGVAVQGNLDPVALFASTSVIQRRATAILDAVAGRSGHIFNLGHGVLPETPVDHVLALVDAVHDYRRP